jgi:crotonobetainyl-CoA:carnitine CoA-transferase CaiB-like acyl-CoA transferase
VSSPNDVADPPAGPLSGTVVLDLTRILAGPWCTQMLGDFGADVIKIERPGIGDDTRSWGPPWMASEQEPPVATYFASANRNKRSVAADIATAQGQEVVRALAAQADVLVENFKVGDLARYGLDFETLKAVNPRLIYCSITGYGQTGPYAHKPGYDFVFQGEAGLMSVTGERDALPGGGPQKVGVAVSDLVTGLYACSAVLAALAYRSRTGMGQAIDLSLFDCTLALGANLAFNHVVAGSVPVRYGNAHPVMVPYQVFKTADGHVIVAAGNDSQWQRFCRAIERPDLAADPRYATGPGRIIHRTVLIPDLERTFLTKASAFWLERMEGQDVPHGRINSYQEAFQHPQASHRGMRLESVGLDGVRVAGVANPAKFSASPVSYRRAAPGLGQHTAEVLRTISAVEPPAGQPEQPV